MFAVTMLISAFLLLNSHVSAQNNKKAENGSKLEIFSNKLPAGAKWVGDKNFVREGGIKIQGTFDNYIYLQSSDSLAKIAGLSIPIRENPGPGEYRYLTFAWIKWGGGQVGIQLGHQLSSTFPNQSGKKYNYTYVAGEGNVISEGYVLSEEIPGNWIITTRDLWKDFGDFTLTSVSFLCPTPRDAGFDGIVLGTTEDTFAFAPGVLPSEVADPVAVSGDDEVALSGTSIAESSEQPQGVQIDWAAQVKAGGFMMYPLYLMGLLTIVIALQRIMTSRQSRLAPKPLRSSVREYLKKGDFAGAIDACEKYPSTLAESLRFIFKHRNAGREVVSQTAGDIAGRDIREHLSSIYPLSVIASLSPLLGLLGTIVGMIEAFGLVALYGDEGGAAILSDSISKALITTAAGLIIAAPSVAIYFVLKKRIMGLASTIEVEIENVITDIYLNDESPEVASPKHQEDCHAPVL
ncbi:MotA/TolQ/ExbB proton channel family protein [Sunxiuqinia indica]|uniref:MotA/TolQ/ExbB proton channel family protein n=1 Tax=Sunxiuqinia indica TaxID=2692584 RepID=UPI001915179C|nr:MotA/TolQ/ExbB proton channel family protein [Sunxiuqinia indica]